MAEPVARLTLYGSCESGNCMKPRWTADLLGVPYDWVEVDIFKGETHAEDFLALNPVGLVPLAVWPDGRRLPESNAIMLFLAEEAGSHLIPADPFERAQMMSWLFWEQYSHEPYIAVRIARLHYCGLAEEDLDPDLLTKGRRALGVMEMQLTARDWLVGEAPSLADLALVAYTRRAHLGGFDLDAFPAIRRWIPRTERALGIAPLDAAPGPV
ncbi:MAG: glutathione S-transferase family protein [Pseudomonadota bacterium]